MFEALYDWRAHMYFIDASDIPMLCQMLFFIWQFKFPWGCHDVETITNRADSNLRRLSEVLEHSSSSLKVITLSYTVVNCHLEVKWVLCDYATIRVSQVHVSLRNWGDCTSKRSWIAYLPNSLVHFSEQRWTTRRPFQAWSLSLLALTEVSWHSSEVLNLRNLENPPFTAMQVC